MYDIYAVYHLYDVYDLYMYILQCTSTTVYISSWLRLYTHHMSLAVLHSTLFGRSGVYERRAHTM